MEPYENVFDSLGRDAAAVVDLNRPDTTLLPSWAQSLSTKSVTELPEGENFTAFDKRLVTEVHVDSKQCRSLAVRFR
jgi:hypothetical protein